MTDDEKVAITERAEEAGISRLGYLRVSGLNTPIHSVVDLKAVADLGKISGDLGRIVGLLGVWLSEKTGQDACLAEIERMKVDFRELQVGIRGKMSDVVFVRKA